MEKTMQAHHFCLTASAVFVLWLAYGHMTIMVLGWLL
jgi:hypothetical protein